MLKYGLFHEKVYSLIMLQVKTVCWILTEFYHKTTNQWRGVSAVSSVEKREKKKEEEEKNVGPVGSITLKQ